ncbi:MAG: hypothetical protein ACE5HJ_01850 [Thermoplasmata archaeon]
MVRLPASKTVIFYAYAVLLSLGAALYVGWGILYNSWNILAAENIGIYALVVVMVVFGLAGMLLYSGD